jgi:hypothetical protein
VHRPNVNLLPNPLRHDARLFSRAGNPDAD